MSRENLKWVNFLEKTYELFFGTNETVRNIRVSVERGSTVIMHNLCVLRQHPTSHAFVYLWWIILAQEDLVH